MVERRCSLCDRIIFDDDDVIVNFDGEVAHAACIETVPPDPEEEPDRE